MPGTVAVSLSHSGALARPWSCSAWRACRIGKSVSSSTTFPDSGISSYAVWLCRKSRTFFRVYSGSSACAEQARGVLSLDGLQVTCLMRPHTAGYYIIALWRTHKSCTYFELLSSCCCLRASLSPPPPPLLALMRKLALLLTGQRSRTTGKAAGWLESEAFKGGVAAGARAAGGQHALGRHCQQCICNRGSSRNMPSCQRGRLDKNVHICYLHVYGFMTPR